MTDRDFDARHDVAPETECPKCGYWQPDYDGFGVMLCVKCAWCSHASIVGDECQLCGLAVEAKDD
jgi:hypothetical protein